MSKQTSPEKQTEILKLLTEGGSIRGVARETGAATGTVRTLKIRGAVKEMPTKPKTQECPICHLFYTTDQEYDLEKHLWLWHAKTTKEVREIIANI